MVTVIDTIKKLCVMVQILRIIVYIDKRLNMSLEIFHFYLFSKTFI